ncbi:hypothetical protein GCM10023192_82740 [Amycolatopsis samaneae]
MDGLSEYFMALPRASGTSGVLRNLAGATGQGQLAACVHRGGGEDDTPPRAAPPKVGGRRFFRRSALVRPRALL